MRPLISRSLWRKLLVAGVAVMALMLAYEVGTSDPRDAAPENLGNPNAPVVGTRLAFSATAYCKGTTTAAGLRVRSGIAAADPTLLPLGSIVSVDANEEHSGIYTVLDTGPAVQGRIIDLYMWSCYDALEFGRQQVGVTILRLGWDPTVSTPSSIDAEFARREAERSATPRASAPVAPTAPPPAPESQPSSETDQTAAPTPD